MVIKLSGKMIRVMCGKRLISDLLGDSVSIARYYAQKETVIRKQKEYLNIGQRGGVYPSVWRPLEIT